MKKLLFVLMCFLGLEATAQVRIVAEPIAFNGETQVEISVSGASPNAVLTIEVTNIPHIPNRSIHITTNSEGAGKERIYSSNIDMCYLTPAERNQVGVLTAYNPNRQVVGTGSLIIYSLYTHRAVGDCYVWQLYRLWNGRHHFYTVDPTERDNALNKSGYKSEGIACSVYNTIHGPRPGTVPLYRTRKGNGNGHFFTTNAAERDNVLRNHGHVDEGIACYVFSIQITNSVPLYRLYNPGTKDHFYTTSDTERDSALRNSGYVNEGIACYVFP